MNIIMNVVLWGIIAYLLFNIFTLQKRKKKGKVLNELVSLIDDKAAFFERSQEAIEGIQDVEYENKIRVIQLWGMAYHDVFNNYEETLDALDLDTLIQNKRGKDNIEMNEDAFFYLYLYIPFLIYLDERQDKQDMLTAKMAGYEERLSDQLLCEMSKHLNDFYNNTGDRGLSYFEDVLNGNYDGYRYLKNFISLYKEVLNVFAAKIYLDNGDTEKFDECAILLKDFAQYRVGKKYLSGLNIPVPADEEVTDSENNTETSEDDEVEKYDFAAKKIETKKEPAEDTETIDVTPIEKEEDKEDTETIDVTPVEKDIEDTDVIDVTPVEKEEKKEEEK